MSGHTAQPSVESHTIVLLARALWSLANSDHATHYLEVSLLEGGVGVFEKTELAGMDPHVERCAAEKDTLLVLVITGEVGDEVTFMILTLPIEAKS